MPLWAKSIPVSFQSSWIADTSYWPCGHGMETVEHGLLECQLYVQQKKELGKKSWSRENEKFLGYPKLLKLTVEYIPLTKGLQIYCRELEILFPVKSYKPTFPAKHPDFPKAKRHTILSESPGTLTHPPFPPVVTQAFSNFFPAFWKSETEIHFLNFPLWLKASTHFPKRTLLVLVDTTQSSGLSGLRVSTIVWQSLRVGEPHTELHVIDFLPLSFALFDTSAESWELEPE